MYRTLHKLKKEQAIDFVLSLKETLFQKQLDGNSYVYILPWGNFGEHTYTMSLLHNLRKRYKICLVLRESKFWLSKYFQESFDFAISIPDSFSNLYEELYNISLLSPGFPYVVWSDLIGNGRLNSELVIKESRINLAESYAFMLELPLNSILEKPTIEYSEMNLKYTLIIPTATTIKIIDNSFWIELYHFLKSKDLNPIIDTTLMKSDIPRNIQTIKLNQEELVKFSISNCHSLVGLRNGMLDFLGGFAKQKCFKLISLYPVDSDQYSLLDTGISVTGVAKSGLSIAKCWSSEQIIDLEVPSPFKNNEELFFKIHNFIKN